MPEYFEPSDPSPFMLMAYRVRPEKRGAIPATTHVDGTGRVQTVDARQNPLYHRLIEAFGHRTGVPVLLNTSFNENEPVVCTPEQAIGVLSAHEDGRARCSAFTSSSGSETRLGSSRADAVLRGFLFFVAPFAFLSGSVHGDEACAFLTSESR